MSVYLGILWYSEDSDQPALAISCNLVGNDPAHAAYLFFMKIIYRIYRRYLEEESY